MLLMVELDGVDVLEYLLEMRLDCCGLFGLGKDFEEIVVREEVESSKTLSFLLKVVVQFFLDLL